MNVSKIITIILLFFSLSCSAHKNDIIPERIRELKNLTVISVDAQPAFRIKFIPESIYQDTNNVYINKWGAVAVDYRGRVYVAGGPIIYVFDPDGHYVTHLGRKGKGPGEFQNMPDIQIQSNRLYAYDNMLKQINIFSLDPPAFSHTLIMSPDKWNNVEKLQTSVFRHYYVKNDGTFLLGFTKKMFSPNQYLHYYPADSTGKALPDHIFKRRSIPLISGGGGASGIPPPQPVSSPVIPSTRSSLMDVSMNGYIFSVWTEDFLIKEYDPEGNYQRAIYYPYKKSLLNRNEIIEHYKEAFHHYKSESSRKHLNAVRNAKFPDTWPAVSYMLVDDQNRLWVATIGDDKDYYEWWVLDTSGKLLARFNSPGKRINRAEEPREIRVIKNGYLYALKTDTTTGLAKIVRYRIEMDKI